MVICFKRDNIWKMPPNYFVLFPLFSSGRTIPRPSSFGIKNGLVLELFASHILCALHYHYHSITDFEINDMDSSLTDGSIFSGVLGPAPGNFKGRSPRVFCSMGSISPCFLGVHVDFLEHLVGVVLNQFYWSSGSTGFAGFVGSL